MGMEEMKPKIPTHDPRGDGLNVQMIRKEVKNSLIYQWWRDHEIVFSFIIGMLYIMFIGFLILLLR